MDETGLRIENWTVIAGDRLAGDVFNRPGHLDGARIVSTPVVEVRLMGDSTWPGSYPVAFTGSGHAYHLGRPAAHFGVAAAKRFIHGKLDEQPPPGACCGACASGAPECEGPQIEAALDTSFQNFECIEVYETSFNPM